MKWIPTSEQLPTDDQTEFLVLSDGIVYIAGYSTGVGQWYERRGGYLDVTHWMPFPDLPEGVK